MSATPATGHGNVKRRHPSVEIQRRVFGLAGAGPIVEIGLALAGPLSLAVLLWGRLPAIAYAVVVICATPAALALLALRTRPRWAAQDVATWLGQADSDEWRADGLGKMARTPNQANAWLAANPEGTVPQRWRAGLMLAVGRVGEARAAIAAMPATTPHEISRRLEVELAADAYEGRGLDVASADAALEADPERSPAERAARRACHAALVSIARGGDGVAELAAAAPAIGRLEGSAARRVLVLRFVYAVAAAVWGAWLIVCALIALATAGGVVWF
jgi:hypothetical protein